MPALATLAYDGRRGEFFAGELVAALRIIQSGDVDSAHMVGSWAGAMGHTQGTGRSAYWAFPQKMNQIGRSAIRAVQARFCLNTSAGITHSL